MLSNQLKVAVIDEGKTRGTAALCRIEGGALHPAKIPVADRWDEVDDDDDVNINDNFMIVNNGQQSPTRVQPNGAMQGGWPVGGLQHHADNSGRGTKKQIKNYTF